MQTLTDTQLETRIKESWDIPFEDPADQFAHIIGGELISSGDEDIEGSHNIIGVILKNPKLRVTNSQLCEIMDMGNHCTSSGSICYEENYAYILWSNLGHI